MKKPVDRNHQRAQFPPTLWHFLARKTLLDLVAQRVRHVSHEQLEKPMQPEIRKPPSRARSRVPTHFNPYSRRPT
jgi:hypothetical protein